MNRLQRIQEKIAESKNGRRAVILALYLGLLTSFLYLSLIKDYFMPPDALYVYTFTDMFHPKTISAFEQAYNIKVVLRYFESNEELLAKFMINRGAGYDLVMTSDYMIELLLKENLLQKIDHQKITHALDLDIKLLDRGFDPKNQYSLPYGWIPYGIIFHRNLFDEVPDTISLDMLFNNPKAMPHSGIASYRICMPDDQREAAILASLYLFENLDAWSDERLNKIEALLVRQKRWVESYVNQDLAYLLLSGLIKAAVAPYFAVDKVLKSSEDFIFALPREGSICSIENLAISKSCKQVDLAHKFIDFVLQEDEQARMSNRFGINPANIEAHKLLRPEILENKNIFPDNAMFEKLHMPSNNMPMKKLEELWLRVKSA